MLKLVLIVFIFLSSNLNYLYAETNSQPGSGVVNRNEIGGKNLAVLSYYQESHAPVAADGSFQVNISTQQAHVLILQEGNQQVRALTIVLPQYPNKIIFDAESTAKATLFQSYGIVATNPQGAEIRIREVEQYRCYPKLVSYYRKYLKDYSLNEIQSNDILLKPDANLSPREREFKGILNQFIEDTGDMYKKMKVP